MEFGKNRKRSPFFMQKIKNNSFHILFLNLNVFLYLWFVLDLTLEKLSIAIGPGDITGTYMFQELLWNRGMETYSFGFPTGVTVKELANYEVTQTILVKVALFFTDNVFLAVNLGIYFSHFICATLVFYVSRHLGLSKNLSMLCAFASTTLPWIPGRIEHPGLWYLSIALIPFLLVNNSADKRGILRAILLGVFVGASGGYVVAFAFVVLIGIFASKVLTFTFTLKEVRIFGSFGAGVVLTSLSSLIFFGFGTTSSLLDRTLQDSIHYGGYFLLSFLPLPSTPLPLQLETKISTLLNQLPELNESTWKSNFGSLALIGAVLILGITALINAIKKSQSKILFSNDYWIKTVFTVSLIVFFFFVKGGLGPILTATIFPPIRGWNRLVIILQICVILLAFVVLQNLSKGSKRVFVLLFGPLVLLQAVANASLIPPSRADYVSDVSRMVSDVELSLNSNCGILQLPELKNDGSGAPKNLNTYDHYLPSTASKKMRWSFGQNPDDFIYRIDLSMSRSEVLQSLERGFCAIEIDLNWENSKAWVAKLESFNLEIIHDSKNFIVFTLP
jgi:hypothetical protein